MKTTTARNLMTMSPAQAAYALALADFEAATLTAEAEKAAAGIDYTGCETEAAIDAMAEREGAIEDAAGIGAKRVSLWNTEARLISWGIEYAQGLPGITAAQWSELQTLRVASAGRVAVRAKVVALCFRLAPVAS